jgi:hypothetical protein
VHVWSKFQTSHVHWGNVEEFFLVLFTSAPWELRDRCRRETLAVPFLLFDDRNLCRI